MSLLPDDRYPWITKQFLTNILKSAKNGLSVHIVDYELHEAVAKGENYGSQMIRVLVNYVVDSDNSSCAQEISFVIKTTLTGEIQALIEKTPLFAKETAFYRDISTKFEKYTPLFDADFKFTPRCYEVNVNPRYFVFEDLKTSSFRTMDRRIGLDFNATRMVVEKLAKYHAMVAMLHEENPQLFDTHKIGTINPENTDIFVCGIKDCQELCGDWPGYEHLGDKLDKLIKVILNKVADEFQCDASEFNVATHGDLWVNNIMFKFDQDNNPIDVIMVDFQLAYYGSPAIDLSYLLYTSTTNDTREDDWDRLIQIYHFELVKTLEAIKYPKRIPTLIDLHTQMLKRSLYAVMVALTLVAPRHMEKTEHADLDLLVFNNAKVKKMRQAIYNKPEVRDRVQYLLDYFDRKGFLDTYK